MTVPSATVVIPARNEEADVERCLRAVLAQDHPHERLEVVLVDGGSTDATAEIAARVLSSGRATWQIVDNPEGTTPSNLNAGLAVAGGEILVRVDARAVIPSDYVRICAEVLVRRPDVAVVGGAQVALARDESTRSVGIARALNNRFAMGGSRYRGGAAAGPTDTVYLGAFRTAELREAGGWDPFFATNQDFELNRRMGRRGLVWFDDRIPVGYLPRQHLGDLWRQYHRFGRWKVRYWRRTGDPPQRRQILLLSSAVVGGGLVAGGLVVAPRHPRSAAVALCAAGGLGVGVEQRGCDGPPGGGPARMLALAAQGVVASAWVTGVAAELARRRRPGARRA